MNSEVEFIIDEQRVRPKKSEVFRLCCDNSLIKRLTGFNPNYNLEEGLRETINWFLELENLKKYKSKIYNT